LPTANPARLFLEAGWMGRHFHAARSPPAVAEIFIRFGQLTSQTTMSDITATNTQIEQDQDRPKDPVPYMNTLTQLTNKMVKEGYVDSFKVEEGMLINQGSEKSYAPEAVSITNFYRFEGQSDPADNTILYVIETEDGGKGTLIDAYGPYSDAGVTAFVDAVENIQKLQKGSGESSAG